MLRSRAIVIRATGERDELVREARRLTDVVTSLPRVHERVADEAAEEIGAATREIDEIARLAGSLDGAAPPEERATRSRLRALGAEAKARRRRLRAIRRRLLEEQYYADDAYGDRLAA
ncbi:MAG TPA: hypothetical protein VFY99_07425 [Solirubrobacterales bacterium]